MEDPTEINRLSWDEHAAIHGREILGKDAIARLRAGEDSLYAIEAEEIGDIRAKRVLHLQCHVGRDTLSLARRGAIVTGLDFSSVAIDVARSLARAAELDAQFVMGAVDEAPQLVPGPFDLVFTTWGVLGWLPDLRRWASSIASVLAPGGELYCADVHPGFVALEERDGRLAPTFDFQTPAERPLEFTDTEPTNYMGAPTQRMHRSTRVWVHSLSTILGALIDAGLQLTMFREHETLPWRRYGAIAVRRPGETLELSGDAESLEAGPDGLWRLRAGLPRLPLSFSLKARKSEKRS